MPDLDFEVESAEAVPHAAAPLLALKLRISSTPSDVPIHSVLLRCQVQIEATRRRYAAEEQPRLFDLFGKTAEWGRTLRTLHWTQTQLSVAGFTGSTLVELPIPCTSDLDITATKYFDALDAGEVPLCLLFSGTIFHATDHSPLQVAQISWEKEANFPLPVAVWQEMMDHYYPNSRWFRLRKDLVDRLAEYKSRGALPTWDDVFTSLLTDAGVDQEPSVEEETTIHASEQVKR